MNDNEEFFFGENFRSFRLHVVETAWLFVIIDFVLILLLSGIFNLTVGKFDAFSILLSLLFISVLGSAVYGIQVRRYIFIWPILLCKAAEVAITIIMLIIAFLLLLFDRNFLVHVIATRISTIEGENVSHYRESLHITFTFIYLFCQLFYCFLMLYVFFNLMDYFRKRTLFAYRQRLTPTYDFITRIHSVRHSESRLRSTPDRLIIEQTLEKIEEESLSKEASPPPPSPPTPPSIPLAASMTQSFTAPRTAVSHSIRLSSQRRYSCQRDPSSESRSSGGMLSSAIHKVTADRQLSVPLGWGGAGNQRPGPRTRARTPNDDAEYHWVGAGPAPRTRARTLNDDVDSPWGEAGPVPRSRTRTSNDGNEYPWRGSGTAPGTKARTPNDGNDYPWGRAGPTPRVRARTPNDDVGYRVGAGPVSRNRAQTLNDDVEYHAGTRRRSSYDAIDRKDSRSQSVLPTVPSMSASLHEPRAQSHDDRQHYSTRRM